MSKRAKGMKFAVRYCSGVDPHQITERLCQNPNYGGSATSIPGCCIIPAVERPIKPLFYEALRQNVAEHGFRNPILLYQTPEGLLLSFGGSRLRVAKKLDKRVPAIIVDYTGRWQMRPEVTEDNWFTFFADVPVVFEFTAIGIETHYSMEKMRRKDYDPGGMKWADPEAEFIREEFPWLS